jgi:hypothetical protein
MACAVALGALPSPAGAQARQGQAGQAQAGPREGEVASDPIRCWWRADRAALRIGERFGLVVTCAVIEVGDIVVVPQLNQLEPGALSLTPYEVVSGRRGQDVVAPPWRYVQFEYAVRLLTDGFFGQEVPVPPLTVTYNLQGTGGNQGRDLTYQLPALPMRILSLVPAGAGDIRDSSGQTFEGLGTRRFRASLATVLAVTAFALAAVLAGFAVVRGVGRLRASRGARVTTLPVPTVLAGCAEALAEVGADVARVGWSPGLARRAVAALRIASAVALGRPVAQAVAGRGARERDGQLTVRTGWLRPRRVLVSAAVTPGTIARHLAREQDDEEPRAQATLSPISRTLAVQSTQSYGRGGTVEGADLDEALAAGRTAVRRLRVGTLWPARTLDALRRSFAGAR